MSVIAHGIDLVHCPRVARMFAEHRERFLKRVYTPAEITYCLQPRDPIPRLSGRFAAKEAVMKVIGTGWTGGVEFIDIETLADPLGRPLVALSGRTKAIAEALGIGCVLISISHAGEYAIASAIGVARE